MRYWLLCIGVTLSVLAIACGGSGGSDDDEGVLSSEFKEPESAIRQLFEFIDKKQWDLEYEALIQEHKDQCPFDAFNTRQTKNSIVGRVKVVKVEDVRELDEWQGIANATALTVTLEITQGDESVETAETFHLIKRGDFYLWGMQEDALQECQDIATGEVEAIEAPATAEAPAGAPSLEGTATADSTSVGEMTTENFGFTWEQEFDRVVYGVILKNGSSTKTAESVDFQVGFYDEGGNVLGAEDFSMPFALPEERVGFGSTVRDVTVPPTEMRIQVRVGRWIDWDGQLVPIPISNVRTQKRSIGGVDVLGEVSNPYDYDLDGLLLEAIFLDETGKVVGGTATFRDVFAGSTTAFDIDGPSSIEPATVEVFAHFSFITLPD